MDEETEAKALVACSEFADAGAAGADACACACICQGSSAFELAAPCAQKTLQEQREREHATLHTLREHLLDAPLVRPPLA